jgi:hypothetical protein
MGSAIPVPPKAKSPLGAARAGGREGVERRRQNAGTSAPLNCVSMKLLTSGDW